MCDECWLKFATFISLPFLRAGNQDSILCRVCRRRERFATTLQRVECATYSGPYYVAEYFHSDPPYDSCDRLCPADTGRADAAAKE
jgi:hypothetical protein